MPKLSEKSTFFKSVVMLFIGALIAAAIGGIGKFVFMCFDTREQVILMKQEREEGISRDLESLRQSIEELKEEDIKGLRDRADDLAAILKEIAWEYQINKELKKLGVIPDPLNTANMTTTSVTTSPPQPPRITPRPSPSPTPTPPPPPSFGEIISSITAPKVSEDEKERILNDSKEWAEDFDARQMSY